MASEHSMELRWVKDYMTGGLGLDSEVLFLL